MSQRILALSSEASISAMTNGDKSTAESLSELESLTVSSRASNDADVKSPNHQIYECEIAFARTFMANAADINDSIKVIFLLYFFRTFRNI